MERCEGRPAAYAQAGSIKVAAAAAGVSRETADWWITKDYLGIKAHFQQAALTFRESLQDLAVERVRNPEKNRGSDILLLGLLNAHWPEKYRRNEVQADETAKEILAELKRMARERRAPGGSMGPPAVVDQQGRDQSADDADHAEGKSQP